MEMKGTAEKLEDYSPPLIRGMRYRLSKAIEATAFPVKGEEVCPAADLHFIEGIFVIEWDRQLIFQGYPIVDPRELSRDQRECYFCLSLSESEEAVRITLVEEIP